MEDYVSPRWDCGELIPATLLAFHANGRTATVDIVDGKLIYEGDVEVTDAANALFEALVRTIDARWLERDQANNRELRCSENSSVQRLTWSRCPCRPQLMS